MDIEAFLRKQPLTDAQRADAWDAFTESKDRDTLTKRLEGLAIPQSVKADLWDMKATPKAAAVSAAAPEPSGPQGYVENAWESLKSIPRAIVEGPLKEIGEPSARRFKEGVESFRQGDPVLGALQLAASVPGAEYVANLSGKASQAIHDARTGNAGGALKNAVESVPMGQTVTGMQDRFKARAEEQFRRDPSTVIATDALGELHGNLAGMALVEKAAPVVKKAAPIAKDAARAVSESAAEATPNDFLVSGIGAGAGRLAGVGADVGAASALVTFKSLKAIPKVFAAVKAGIMERAGVSGAAAEKAMITMPPEKLAETARTVAPKEYDAAFRSHEPAISPERAAEKARVRAVVEANREKQRAKFAAEDEAKAQAAAKPVEAPARPVVEEAPPAPVQPAPEPVAAPEAPQNINPNIVDGNGNPIPDWTPERAREAVANMPWRIAEREAAARKAAKPAAPVESAGRTEVVDVLREVAKAKPVKSGKPMKVEYFDPETGRNVRAFIRPEDLEGRTFEPPKSAKEIAALKAEAEAAKAPKPAEVPETPAPVAVDPLPPKNSWVQSWEESTVPMTEAEASDALNASAARQEARGNLSRKENIAALKALGERAKFPSEAGASAADVLREVADNPKGRVTLQPELVDRIGKAISPQAALDDLTTHGAGDGKRIPSADARQMVDEVWKAKDPGYKSVEQWMMERRDKWDSERTASPSTRSGNQGKGADLAALLEQDGKVPAKDAPYKGEESLEPTVRQAIDFDQDQLKKGLEPLAKKGKATRSDDLHKDIMGQIGGVKWSDIQRYSGRTIKDIPQRLRRILRKQPAEDLASYFEHSGEKWGLKSVDELVHRLLTQDETLNMNDGLPDATLKAKDVAEAAGMTPKQAHKALVENHGNPREMALRRVLHEKDPFDSQTIRDLAMESDAAEPDVAAFDGPNPWDEPAIPAKTKKKKGKK